MSKKESKPRYFKGRYMISFYDASDDVLIAMFDNIKEICTYKNKEFNEKNYTLIKVELYRALKRSDHCTWMLNGRLMHVYLIDVIKDDD